jgi:predicted nucleotidyltransferase
MQVHQRVPLDSAYLANFCQRHGVRRLSLFGSVLRDDFDPQRSDVDLLVEFEPDAKRSLFDVGGMMHELTERLGQQVDIRTPRDLSPYFRDRVLREAHTIYADE